MINKYTLLFKDLTLELKYQEFQQQKKRKPLMQKLIFIIFLVIIAKLIALIMNFDLKELYVTIGYLIAILSLAFILKFKPQLSRWTLIIINYLTLLTYSQTDEGQNQYQYQLQSALIVSFQFIVINTGEFLDALMQVISFFSFYLSYFILYQPNFPYSIALTTFLFEFLLIVTFYNNISAERSKFKLTIIDDKWDQILENMMVEPCIIFNFNLLKTSFVLKKSIDFIYGIDTTEQLIQFLRNSNVNQDSKINLEDFIFKKVKQLCKDNIQLWNQKLTIKYNKKLHDIYYSILSETSPIIVIKIKQFKFSHIEKDSDLEKNYQYKYKILLKSIFLQLRFIGQYSIPCLNSILKIILYHYLLEKRDNKSIAPIKIDKVVKQMKLIYPQMQISIENCQSSFRVLGQKDSLYLVLMEVFETMLSKQIHIKIINQEFSKKFIIYGILNERAKEKLNSRLLYYKKNVEIIEITDQCVSLILQCEAQDLKHNKNESI
ncbi:unnamed protein product [Paramecium sonneborni]|uniref:Transmembrane protein n=1 Tax=Paramecium sonneborni TaxID=65129 RepID=A0A8S1QQC2_9CILI|nr:unnamed protein product [Paramecium sonneborni]